MESPECCTATMTKGSKHWHCFTCGAELSEEECPHCMEIYVGFHMCRDTQENYD